MTCFVRVWRFARRFTGPVAAASLVATCVGLVWALLVANPNR